MVKKIEFVGKTLVINIKEERILVIGDLHLGYEENLHRVGVFVRKNLFEEILNELKIIFENVGKIDEIVLLGDLKHNFGKILREEWKEIEKLIDYLKERTNKLVIIKGNHDIMTNIIGKELGFEMVRYYIKEDIIFIHGDKDFEIIWDDKIKTVVMGHLHPAINITDGIKIEKYKCFLNGNYKRKEFIILPSFVSINEGTDPRDFKIKLPWSLKLENFNVNVVGEQLEVLKFGKLKKIN